MKVLFVADEPTSGGATECLIDLTVALESTYGVECTVLTCQQSDLNSRLGESGVSSVVTGHKAFLVSPPESKWKAPVKFARDYFYWKHHYGESIKLAERALDVSSFDIVHSNLPRIDLGIALASKHRIPHVVHLREYSFTHFQCWSYRPKPVRYISDNSAALIAISDSVGRAWVNLGADSSKVHRIYDGLPYTCTPRPQRNASERRVAFLGGFDRYKGFSDVIGALSLLDESYRSRLRIDVYGGFSEKQAKAARQSLSERGVNGIVNMVGLSNDVPNVLQDYDAGLICSEAEAFGRTTVEMMSAGLVVIGANTGATPELLGDGSYGLLYDKRNPAESLSRALATMVDDYDRLEDMRSRARARSKDFTLKRTVSGVYELYRTLLAQTQAR